MRSIKRLPPWPALQFCAYRCVAHLSIAHCRPDVAVPQSALHRLNLVALLQQLGSYRVAELVDGIARLPLRV